jgi:16S rRNA (cytosine967-C5)-methyltransferase
MKEASRIQAVIEVLSEVFKNHLPADIVMDKYLKERRYIGSKDRRFICDTCWQIIRHRLSLSEKIGGTDSVRLVVAKYLLENGNDIDLLFNGEEYAPALLTAEEKKILTTSAPENLSEEAFYETPHWLIEKFDNKRLLEALNGVAPLDVRANLTSREQAKERLKKEGLFFSFTPYSPLGLRSEDRINLNNCMTYQDGEIEVMDEASQLLALLCRVKAHHKIMDYCAGAGGKALCMGAELHNEGVVYAHDISQERLSRIKKRAERLDILNIKICPTVTDEDYDRFIIDAPCSGSGTWRRSPDAKFRLTPQKLKDIQVTQADLLEFGAKHTKSGGRLIYMTCSVFKEENEAQIETFLAKHPEFTPLNHRELWQNTLDMSFYPFESEKYLHFTPLNTKTDGFFFCAMIKM